MGLHDDAQDPKPPGADFPSVFENEWLVQRRRILFMTLMSWFVPSLSCPPYKPKGFR